MLLKMAFRNLWRRRFRTGITLVALGGSFALLLFFVAITEGSHQLMIDLAIRMQAGHVVIQAPEFQKERSLELRVTDPDGVMDRLGPLPKDWIVTRRIFTTGLLRSADGSVMLDNLMAVDLENERRVSDVGRKLVRGAWLEDQTPGILIGEKAARLLKVDVGDKVVVSCSGLTQKVEERFLVAGVFRVGGETDRGLAMIGLARGQALLGMGDAVSQLAFFMPPDDSFAAARHLRAKLAGRPVAVLHWQEALPVLTQLLWVDDISMQVFIFIILVIVAAAILNTVLMSVMEMEGIAFTDRIHPVLLLGSGLILSAVVLGMTLLSAVWPALRAKRILPVKALRQM